MKSFLIIKRPFVKIMYAHNMCDLEDRINDFIDKIVKTDNGTLDSVDITKDGSSAADGFIASIRYTAVEKVRE